MQAQIIPVAEIHNKYAENIFEVLKENNIRVEFDDSNNSFGKKIRNSKKNKLPYYIVVGDQDIADNKLTLESRDQKQSEQISLEELVRKFKSENK